MKKRLRVFLLALVAVGCFALMCMGVLAAFPLTMIGFIGLFGGLIEMMWDLAGMALFGLTTVALCSLCCFGGLMYIFTACLDGIGGAPCKMEKPIVIMTVISVAVTVCIFLSTQMANTDWFVAACIMADVQHTLFIASYLHRWRRRKLCAEASSLQQDSPPCSEASSC